MSNPRRWPVAAAAILLAAFTAAGRSEAPAPDRLLETLEAVSDLDALTETLWPGWEISATPFALYEPDGVCYLLHHPRPPVSFARVRGRARIKAAFYRGPATSPDVRADLLEVNGVPTAFVEAVRFSTDPVTLSVREAFRVLIRGACPEALEPVELVGEYPVDARHLAMADIECEILSRAASADEDSLRRLVSEFVAVRQLRRISAGPRVAQHERWLEMRDGVPLYIGERARELAPRPLNGEDGPASARDAARPLDLGRRPETSDAAEWYREGRFACTGARVCLVLERLGIAWQREIAGRCVDPYDVLRSHVAGSLPRASEVLDRMLLEERTLEKTEALEAAKTDEGRLFESIVSDRGPVLCVATAQLSSVSVSLDRQNVVRVDAHREVHTRVLKVEFSGGTHVYFTGRSVAATLGDALDYREFITRSPGDLSVTADGEALELTPGIHSVSHSLLVEGEGISVQARAAAVVVGENRITLMLQQ